MLWLLLLFSCECNCADTLNPVCGSNGLTYDNECFAVCDGVEWVRGECSGCPDIHDPVCGDDGITYPNECLAELADVRVASQGECSGPM